MSNKVGKKMGNEILFVDEIQLNHSNSNCTKSKYYSDNGIGKKSNIRNRLDNKKF